MKCVAKFFIIVCLIVSTGGLVQAEVLLFYNNTFIEIPPGDLYQDQIVELKDRISNGLDVEQSMVTLGNLDMISKKGVTYNCPSKIYVDYDSDKNKVNRYRIEYTPISLDTMNPDFTTSNPLKFDKPEIIISDFNKGKKIRQWTDDGKINTQEIDMMQFAEAEWPFAALVTYKIVSENEPLEEVSIADLKSSKHAIQNMLVNLEENGNSVEVVMNKSSNIAKFTIDFFEQYKIPENSTRVDASSQTRSTMDFVRVVEPEESQGLFEIQ